MSRRRFLSPYHQKDALDEISRRVQKEDESALVYLNHMVMLFQTVSHSVEEDRMVHIIRRNLRPEIQSLVGPWEPRTLEALEKILSLLQTSTVHKSLDEKKRSFYRRSFSKKVSEIEIASDDEEEAANLTPDEIAALIRKGIQKKRDNLVAKV